MTFKEMVKAALWTAAAAAMTVSVGLLVVGLWTLGAALDAWSN